MSDCHKFLHKLTLTFSNCARIFQVINKKCTENQTRNIIRTAATSTDDRKQKIMNLLRQITHNQSPVIQGFGLNVDGDFIKVPARQLGNYFCV